MRRESIWAALLVGVIAIATGCSDSNDGVLAADELPVESLSLDEDAPVGIDGALKASDYVVVATIDGVTDGARFYGRTEESPSDDLFEDVELNVTVIEVLKGEPTKTLAIRWPGYITSSESSADRTAVLEVGGITVQDLTLGDTYLMFLKQYEAPFGLSPVALSTAMIELDSEQRGAGQISGYFEEYRGSTIDQIAEAAGAER